MTWTTHIVKKNECEMPSPGRQPSQMSVTRSPKCAPSFVAVNTKKVYYNQIDNDGSHDERNLKWSTIVVAYKLR